MARRIFAASRTAVRKYEKAVAARRRCSAGTSGAPRVAIENAPGRTAILGAYSVARVARVRYTLLRRSRDAPRLRSALARISRGPIENSGVGVAACDVPAREY